MSGIDHNSSAKSPKFFSPEFEAFRRISGASPESFGGVPVACSRGLGTPLEVRSQAKPKGVVDAAFWVRSLSTGSTAFSTATAVFMTATAVMNTATAAGAQKAFVALARLVVVVASFLSFSFVVVRFVLWLRRI